MNQPVKIRQHGVFPRRQTARKDQDTVTWSYDTSKDWYVVFEDDSPFTRSSFYPTSPMGEIDPGADVGDYKYTVYVEGHRIDPTIVIV